MPYQLRNYQPDDLTILAEIYSGAIRHLGLKHYSPKQVAAWSSFPQDLASFADWITGANTFVAVNKAGLPVGFGGLAMHGRISSLFVAPGYQRQGIASTLLTHLLKTAKSRGFDTVTTEASEFSKPVFAKFGFYVKEIEHTEFKGVKFSRYVMQVNLPMD